MNDRGFKFHKSVQGSKRLIWKVKSGFQSQSYPLLLRALTTWTLAYSVARIKEFD